MLEEKIKERAAVLASLGVVIVMIVVTAIIINVMGGSTLKIEYADEERSATVTIGEDDVVNTESDEHGMGEAGEVVEKLDIPTVESIDAPGPVVDTEAGEGVSLVECPEGEEECALGAYIYAPVDTWSAFKNAALGQCWNTDGAYGAQCWDLADVFWQNAAGRRAQTCGTGAAKGMIADGCWQKNAGDDFMMIWDATKIQPGDWLIFTNGTWGHVGMAVGTYNNGYVTLLGQNQGGSACAGGGSAGNIINISLKNFGGAFRYKPYEEARLKAEEEARKRAEEEARKKAEEEAKKKAESGADINVTTTYTVKKGDTLGKIAREFCGYVGKNLFGDSGYAQKMADLNIIEDRGLIYIAQSIKCPES